MTNVEGRKANEKRRAPSIGRLAVECGVIDLSSFVTGHL
jgi:hypothetical protein